MSEEGQVWSLKLTYENDASTIYPAFTLQEALARAQQLVACRGNRGSSFPPIRSIDVYRQGER